MKLSLKSTRIGFETTRMRTKITEISENHGRKITEYIHYSLDIIPARLFFTVRNARKDPAIELF